MGIYDGMVMNIKDEPRIVQDIWRTINTDAYMWMPIWGEARSGKSTLALLLSYKVYKDWDDVLAAIVFNLNDVLHKMRRGEPKLFPTVTKPVHMRLPYVIWDDFAARSGKAQTQHEKAWDIFKGAFDTLGTRLAVLAATMVNPRSPTEQILQKYTHEVLVEVRHDGRREYKYDKCKSQQDFHGWKARQNKDWQEIQEFGQVPLDVFKQYDEMRTSLVDEVYVAMQDAMVEENVDRLLKRVQPSDIELLKHIQRQGVINYMFIKRTMGDAGIKALTRCKARGLVVPTRRGQTYYLYDITDLGLDLLKAELGEVPKKAEDVKLVKTVKI